LPSGLPVEEEEEVGQMSAPLFFNVSDS